MFIIRLWHYKLLPVLPDRFIVAEWRECIAIKRQWEKGTLKHRLVSYVMDYYPIAFLEYVDLVVKELENRNIKYQRKYYNEIQAFCVVPINTKGNMGSYYPEHNDRYLTQCYFNLQEKYDRGIVTEEEWNKIKNANLLENVSVLDLYG